MSSHPLARRGRDRPDRPRRAALPGRDQPHREHPSRGPRTPLAGGAVGSVAVRFRLGSRPAGGPHVLSSRLLIALALAAIAALGAGLAACGGGGSSEESPQAVIENATLEGIESANLDLSLKVKSTGKEGSDLDVSVSGPFEEPGRQRTSRRWTSKPPRRANYKGEDVDFDGGLVLLPSSAFVKLRRGRVRSRPDDLQLRRIAPRPQPEGSGRRIEGHQRMPRSGRRLDFTKLGEDLKNEGTRRSRRHRHDQAQRRARPDRGERPAHPN